MTLTAFGAAAFGLVVGYLAHYLVRKDAQAGVADLAAIIGAVVGAAVLNVISGPIALNWYLIGLALGFFVYWLALLLGREQVRKIIGKAVRPLPLFPFLKQSNTV